MLEITSEDMPLPKQMYFFANFFYNFFDRFKGISSLLNNLETNSIRKHIAKLNIVKPIYVTGLARSGTTITLEMLSNHPELGFHRYLNMPIPFLPLWVTRIGEKVPLMTKPVERVHKDGIMVTRKSPEELEEALWLKFFPNLHSERRSQIMGSSITNPAFEEFYRDQIRKLLYAQNRERYLAKNNYNLTRMDYIQKIFPDAKFLILIRHPVDQIASSMKQNRIFDEMYEKEKIMFRMSQRIGHYEFGRDRLYVNVGDVSVIRQIRRLCKGGQVAKGLAFYWKSLYDYVGEKLKADSEFAKATLIIRHEDYIETPGETIDRILTHVELDPLKFSKTRKYYCSQFHKPTYYSPNFDQQEMEEILDITRATANQFGYNL